MFNGADARLPILAFGIARHVVGRPLTTSMSVKMALFTFSANDSYPLPDPTLDEITVTIDATNGTMIVQVPGETAVPYPLVDEESEPLPRAIFVDLNASPEAFQVGTVTYSRPGLMVQYIALNDVEISFRVSASEGHLGILDIRDVGRQASIVKYYFELMPVVLSIEGNYLVVKTLEYQTGDPGGPWYVLP